MNFPDSVPIIFIKCKVYNKIKKKLVKLAATTRHNISQQDKNAFSPKEQKRKEQEKKLTLYIIL